MYKVGLLIFSESKNREDVYKQRKPIQDREVNRFKEELEDEIEFIVPGEIRSKKDVRVAIEELNASDVSAIIFYLPIFISASLVVHASILTNLTIIIMGNSTEGTLSRLSLLASGGALDQAGLSNKRIVGDISDQATKQELLRYLRVIETSNKLKGSTLGCIGGRSLGINSNTADLSQWIRIFGVDIEHIDQYEIVLRANNISDDKVIQYKDWINEKYGCVCFKKGRLEDEHINKMIRSYLATKSLIKDYELDFLAIKCQPELSNGYVVQCLNVQLLNDPYDAEGQKEPVACSCEADNDGALTMQILKLISNGQPVALQDIMLVEDRRMVLANCGATASYFAGLSDKPEKNLGKVYLQPHGFGAAGGAATQFVCASDVFTYARLFRRNREYQMTILKGKTVEKPREELDTFKPTSFVEVDINSSDFLKEFGSNHIHCVRGDYVIELVEFCKYKNIEYKVY